jgi:acetyltransferase EpsM
MERVAIIGAGGHAAVVASTLLADKKSIYGYFDDDPKTWNTEILGIPVFGPISELLYSKHNFNRAIIAIGKNSLRKKLSEELNLDWISAVHPFSWISPDAKIGIGSVICAGSIIQPRSVIGRHVIINTKSSIDHDCTVGDFSHVAEAHLAGGASIDEGVFVALTSTILPSINVGSWSIVGAGALVTKNVPEKVTVVGTPARVLKRNEH